MEVTLPLTFTLIIPLMFHVKDVSFPKFLWSEDWPKPQPFGKQNRKLMRNLTVVAKFLSPDREVVSQFGDSVVSCVGICAFAEKETLRDVTIYK